MSKNIKKDRRLLWDVLNALVREWGHDDVLRALSKFEYKTQFKLDITDSDIRNDGALENKKKAARKKPTAVDQVARMEITDERKSALMHLATQFDKKMFLPTIGNIRHFLEMNGENSNGLKQRPESFRKVLNVVAKFPNETLNELLRTHTGPSQLGPLSDAIKSASAIVRGGDMPGSDVEEPGNKQENEG